MLSAAMGLVFSGHRQKSRSFVAMAPQDDSVRRRDDGVRRSDDGVRRSMEGFPGLL
jgi:hypothetical protein